MAPSPEYDKEPKAPDKNITSAPNEELKNPLGVVSDQINSDQKATTGLADGEIETGSGGQPGYVPLIETNDSPREQYLKNMVGGVGLPISTFLTVCLSILGSNALIAFDNERL
ncbi:hypothetical protein EVAR_20372_1 [Eumeta japonica]|uniref:Uncharacterized protein n=1 Tax=Eumeta variegata TaxID=151549 RepID=A0A4C1VUM7_EUMVA|nr:hypothetical protein EVAR_20372_1 [Eumeta japonica]